MNILEITSYPPPRAGWGMRVQLLKRHLEARGHDCVVLNIGQSRRRPSPEYETVLSGFDYLKKVWRYSARGYLAHVHVNGASPQGFVLAIVAEIVNVIWGKRCILTFHAGADQIYFPRPKYPWLLPMFWILFGIPRRIICNSTAVKDKIVEYGIAAEKILPIQAFSSQYLEFERQPLGAEVDAFYRHFPQLVFSYINIRPKFFPLTVLDGFAQVAARNPRCGLVLCGVGGYAEGDLQQAVAERLRRADLTGRVLLIEDLEHDAFLTALSQSTIFLRSHISDGVCSSVLEALALKVPVVACANGQRPPGVLTYTADNANDLSAVLTDALSRRDLLVSTLPIPEIPDTLTVEADVLIGNGATHPRGDSVCAA